MSNGKPWLPTHTAEMSVLTGRGWSDARIGRKLGFARETVTRRRNAIGKEPCRCNYWTAPLSKFPTLTAEDWRKAAENWRLVQRLSRKMQQIGLTS